MNTANQITIFRIFAVPFFLYFLLAGIHGGEYIAAGIFTVAAITDCLDGYLARTRNLETNTGKFLDPLADKLLVCSALVGLVGLGWIPAWIAIVIISRELTITSLRTIAASGGHLIEASPLGKYKTFTQIFALVAIMIHDFPASLLSIPVGIPVLYVSLVMSILSALDYFLKNRDVFRN